MASSYKRPGSLPINLHRLLVASQPTYQNSSSHTSLCLKIQASKDNQTNTTRRHLQNTKPEDPAASNNQQPSGCLAPLAASPLSTKPPRALPLPPSSPTTPALRAPPTDPRRLRQGQTTRQALSRPAARAPQCRLRASLASTAPGTKSCRSSPAAAARQSSSTGASRSKRRTRQGLTSRAGLRSAPSSPDELLTAQTPLAQTDYTPGTL